MINGENDVEIWFAGSGLVEGSKSGVLGSIDRITGDVLAEYWLSAMGHDESLRRSSSVVAPPARWPRLEGPETPG